MKIAAGILLFTIGNILAWFQFNSQFVWDWWKAKPLLPNLVFGIPMGICFWYAIKYIMEDTNLLWTSKLIGFSVSNVTFAILTYILIKESMFAPKTMVCLALSVAIIGVQVFWK